MEQAGVRDGPRDETDQTRLSARRRSGEPDKEEVKRKSQMQFKLFAKASIALNCFFTVCWFAEKRLW